MMNPYIGTISINILLKCFHALYLLRIHGDPNSIYTTIDRFLSDGYAVIYGIEKMEAVTADGSKSQFISGVYAKMQQSGLIAEVEQHIQNGTLKIMDRNEIFSSNSATSPDVKSLVNKWLSIIKEFRRKGNFKGIVALAGGITVTADRNDQSKLVSHEQAILRAVTELGLLSIICCYVEESIDKLHFNNLISIIKSHQCAISNGNGKGMNGESKYIYSSILLEAITDGIDDALGKGGARLVMQTMKFIYNIDEAAILSNPGVFEEKLQKILGNAYKVVLASVTKRVKEMLV